MNSKEPHHDLTVYIDPDCLIVFRKLTILGSLHGCACNLFYTPIIAQELVTLYDIQLDTPFWACRSLALDTNKCQK